MTRKGGEKGFTLVELLVVIAIVLILASLLVPSFEYMRTDAEGAVCNGRLRNLWTAFSFYLHDGNGWPQVPGEIQIGSQQEQQWWLDFTKENMRLSSNEWQCPSIKRMMNSSTNATKQCLISYLPTLFDSKPRTALSWPQMPWFTEIANAHRKGNLTIRTDGSVMASGTSNPQ
ncbi:MAG: prepilin-type N-terminal cleavage/methylation domain-containing protein [bacterium]